MEITDIEPSLKIPSHSIETSESSELSEKIDESTFQIHEMNEETNNSIPRTKNEINPVEVIPNYDSIESRRKCLGVGEFMEDQLKEFGKLISIVQKQILVEPNVGSPILNLESILWIEENEPLGRIEDVFGSVSKPYYVVFMDNFLFEKLSQGKLPTGLSIFMKFSTVKVIHEKEITEKMRMKGTDASNRFDEEITEKDEMEFSDDEKEAITKQNKKSNKRKHHEKEFQPFVTPINSMALPFNFVFGNNFSN